jgi:hypothetical protein
MLVGEMDRRLHALAVTFTVSMLAGWTVGPLPAAEGAEFNCGDPVLTNYAQPLDGLPDNRLPGESLSFAPRDVELKAGRSVVVDGEPIAYTLALNRPDFGSGPRPASLDWALSLGLEPIDRQGRPTAEAEPRRWRIGRLNTSERQFGLRADPGLYRVSVGIRRLGGPVLASYRQFVRVLPSRWNLSISIRGGKSFRPGDSVTARIENRGTREVGLPAGSGFAIERLESGTWTAIVPEQVLSVMFEDPEFLAGGRASGCSFLAIPADSTPGRFRFSADWQAGLARPGRCSDRSSFVVKGGII